MTKKKLTEGERAGFELIQRKEQILKFIPNAAEKERFFQILLREVGANPDLASCTLPSLISAAIEVAKLGLEFGGTLQGAHLIPFKTKQGKIAQLIIGYRGLMTLMRRGDPTIASIEARVVKENDEFVTTDVGLAHSFDAFQPRGEMVGVYCKVWFKDGSRPVFETMSMEDVDKIRALSLAKNRGPWVDHYDQMARKTVIRRMANYLELSADVRDGLSGIDKREFDMAKVIDVDVAPVGVDATKEAMVLSMKESAGSYDQANAEKDSQLKKETQAAFLADVTEPVDVRADPPVDVEDGFFKDLDKPMKKGASD